MVNQKSCRNCDNSNVGNYCPNCGESKYEKITIKSLLGDVLSNLFDIEGPILRTFIQLTLKPWELIQSYLNGKRKVYYKPFPYYLLFATLYSFVLFFIPESMAEINKLPYSTGDEEYIIFYTKVMEFMSNYQTQIMLLQPPFFAILLWGGYKKSLNITYADSLVMSLYLLGHMLMLSILLLFVDKVYSGISSHLIIIISIIYCSVVLNKMSDESYLKSLLSSSLIYLLTLSFFMILAIIIGFIYTLLF